MAPVKKTARRAREHFLMDALPPTFGKFCDNWISSVKMSRCQLIGIVLGFLARVFRAKLARERVEMKCLPARRQKKPPRILKSTLQSAATLFSPQFSRVFFSGLRLRFFRFLSIISEPGTG